jgi:hypothetical protein
LTGVRVRLKRGWQRTYATLTPGNVYRVVGRDASMVRVITDCGEPVLFEWRAFEVIDDREDAPPAFDVPGFYERWFDGDPQARRTFRMHVSQICHREANAREEPEITYRRVAPRSPTADEPVVLSELDEANWEIRRAEVYADGRTLFAFVKANPGVVTG